MAMYENQNSKIIQFAKDDDYCILCGKDIKGPSMVDVERKLKGKLYGKKIFKLNYRGTFICLCKDHIKQIYDDLGGDMNE